MGELLADLVDAGASGRAAGRTEAWMLLGPDGTVLPLDRSLDECGVVDRAELMLRERPAGRASAAGDRLSPAGAPLGPVAPGGPLERGRSSLPIRLGVVSRAARATGALVSVGAPGEASGGSGPGKTSRSALSLPGRRSPLARFEQNWEESNYLHRLHERIATPRLSRCATIAVISPKGGVGKTMLSVALGALLARVRRDRIVAVDTNPDYGSLGPALIPGHDVFVDDLAGVLRRPELTVPELDSYLGRGPDGLMVLPAPTDPDRMDRIGRETYTEVITGLQGLVGMLILDCGTGLKDPAAQAAVLRADQLVLVSDAEPATASLVAQAADLLRLSGLPLTLVVNKVPRRKKAARLDIERLGAVIVEATGLVSVGFDEQVAAAVAQGNFTWDHAPEAWRRAIGELAAILCADWPRLGLSG